MRENVFKILLVSVMAALILTSIAIADKIKEEFKEGIEQYDNGNYLDATETFSGLLEKGYRYQELYYNLGCAYFKAGSLGKAILNFNRALQLNPSDEDARINLEYARQFTIDKIEKPEKPFFVKAVNSIVNLFDLNTGLLAASSLIWLTCLFIAGIIWFKWRDSIVWYVLTILLILVVVSGFISYQQIRADVHFKAGVLIAKQADVHTGPGSDFPLQFTAHEGLEFQLEELREGYWRIQLENGVKGWVRQESVGVI
ncbi:MAG: tetratricopeptide repeat protein [candidate division Zixibacteria bacterium]|nr:tetratricopeptide repeat protein [candidate division Zixibacteria bacterium]